MKNIVTSFKINTLSSRKGLGVGLLLLLCLSVGQMWANTTFADGDVLFYDFSAVTGGGGVNWHTGSIMAYDASGAGKIKCVMFTSSITMTNSWVIAKTAKASWAEIKLTTDRPAGKNCIKIGSDGKSYTWDTRSLAEEVAAGTFIMVYGGELSSWSQTNYYFMSANSTDNVIGQAHANQSVTINSETYKFGPAAIASGTYYQGHWNSGLSCAIAAGCAYVVRGNTTNTTYYEQKATSGDNRLYRIKKQGSTSPTTSLSPTCPSSITAGSKLSFTPGSAGVSVLGRSNSIKYYLKNGSTYTEKTLSDGKLDVSDLGVGDYSIITLLYDGYIYVKASTSNFSVTAPSTATLTYHANYITTSGNGSGSVPAAQEVTLGSSATVAGKNTLAFVNYTFSGWNTEEHITGTDYAVGSSITMDANKDLYAKWTRTIPLDDQGATTAVTGDVYGTYNSSSLPSFTNPAKTGYTFQGWYTQIGGGGNFVINTSRVFQANKTNWTNGSSQFIRPSTSTSSLYAKWTQSVTLNANTANHGSGSNRTATATWNLGTVTISTHCTPAAGYKLEGYYTAATGGTKILNADGSFAATNITNYITSGLWTKTGATTLYAHYEPLPKVYLKNTMNWANAYVTFYKSEYWDATNGAGSYTESANYATGPVAMTYNSATGLFEYQCPSEYTYTYACFTKDQQNNYGNFYETEAIYCNNNLQYDKVAIVAAQTSSTHNSTKYYTDKTNGNIEFVALASGEGTGWFFPGGWSSWETKGNEATWNSTNVHFEKTLAANTSYEFKVYNHGVYYGNSGTYTATGSKTFTNGGSNCTLSTTLAGTYLFDYNVSTNSLTITFPEVYAVSGSFNSWTETTNLAFTGNDGTYSVSINGSGTNYEFKVLDNAVWYGHANKTFTATESNVALSTGSSNIKLKADVYPSGTYTFAYNKSTHKVGVTYPTNYVVNFGKRTGGNTVTAKINNTTPFTTGTKIASGTSVTFAQTAKTGYTFEGWYNASSGGTRVSTSSSYTTTISATTNAYANYTPNNYTVTLDVDEEHVGSTTGATTSHSVTYNTVTTAIPNLPTAAANYGLYGYYTDHNGAGTKLINGDGTWIASVAGYTDANKKWIHDGDVTLYAYYKQAEITAITLDADMKEPMPSADPDDETKNYVIANPTVDPNPEGTTTICWEFLYDNGNPLPAGHEPTAYTEGGTKPNQVRFPIVGLSAGTYKIRATLRSGSSCGGGTELSTLDKQLVISNAYTVTILYQDDDHNTLAASTTSPGKATEWTTISAPDFFGYTFNGWQLGDGITSEDPTSKQTDFRYKATFDGTIIAEYVKKQYIYLDLSQTFGSGAWTTPYVYFYSNNPWVDGKGVGATGHTNYISGSGHVMTQIEGTNIWYYDYSEVSGACNYVAFTKANQTTYEHFYATEVIFRGDFSEGTPLFVPATPQDAETVNGNAKYYNKGYWVAYLGDLPGYTMLIYNSAGNVELKRESFVSANKRVPMTVPVDLDPGTYQIEVYRNDGYYYQHTGGNFTSASKGPKPLDGGSKGSLQANASGTYIFTLGYSSGNLQLSVAYPATVGDFRLVYTDNATWTQTHTIETWKRPSHPIIHRANGVDTVSFFISKGAGITAKIRWEKATAISNSSVTWGTTGSWTTTGLTDVETAGVYNFKVTQNADGTAISSIERIGEYEGSYYIRCNALNSKWDHYTTDPDHRMTYSSFSESAANSFGEQYSHYKAKWCPRNTNIKFCIANDYSPCLTDTLSNDATFSNTESDGTLKYEKDGGNMKYNDANAYLDKYSANVRFMWNRATNKISRAYVSAATSGQAKFLVLQGSGTTNSNIYNGNTGAAFTADPPGANSVILQDDQNWIYEVIIQANPSALAKLYANYNGVTQWFRGAAGTPFVNGTNAIELIGGDPVSTKYSVRVIYDFKTNRLVCAWLPTGASQEIGSNLDVDADVMVIREHQGPAQCITFANDAKMTDVKTVYGAMKFNRWILNNRAHPEDIDKEHCRPNNLGNDLTNYHPVLPVGEQKSIYERSLYFISFPFDVRVSEIFGFGRYWDEWYLEYYDGLTRAKNGFWQDSPPNWKYVTPEMATDYVLKANEGYILGLDLDYMQADNTSFWAEGICTVELYFPSTTTIETLKSTNCTIPALNAIEGDPYRCTINRGTAEGDRRVKDSYWRCLGVPSFNIYNSALKDGSGNTITWQTNYSWDANPNTLPFIYMWNKVDNTLTAQSTSAFRFDPMHAYLAQIGGEIQWTAVSSKPSSIVARRENEEPATEYNWCLELSRNDEMVDQTYIRMSNLEQVTDTFDFGQDLNKEFNKTRSNIYSYIGYEQVAANSMPLKTEQTTIVAVGLNILSAGDYTLAMPDGTDGVGVTLVDSETGTRTNLSAGMTYTLSLAKGNYNSRFYLEISKVKETPTGLEPTTDSSLKGREVRKVLIDGILYIVRDGKIFDARGARVE